MYFANMVSLFLTVMTKPLIIDSTIYAVELPKMEIHEQTIAGSIIDHSLDDYLYVLTARYMYKIDPDYLSIKDRIPLPQRFNYISINQKYIILVTNGEIVLLDKENLSFKTGIGIEYGDYRPMMTANKIIAKSYNNLLHLVTNSGGKSILKIFDLVTGRLLKKKTVDELRAYEFHPDENIITTLDVQNRIVLYDLHLKKKNELNLTVTGDEFVSYGNGFLIYNAEGIFFITKTGGKVDFQPLPIKKQEIVERFLFVTDHGIVYLDSLTLRPKKIFKSVPAFKRLFRVQSDVSEYALALDQKSHFHLLDLGMLTTVPMIESIDEMQEKIPEFATVNTDSLWYFQVGAFSNYENARQMVTKLQQRSIPVFIDSTDYYRVKFGGFQDRSKAIEIVEYLDIDGWFIYQNKIEQITSVEFLVGFQKYILNNGVIIRSNQ